MESGTTLRAVSSLDLFIMSWISWQSRSYAAYMITYASLLEAGMEGGEGGGHMRRTSTHYWHF